MGYLRGVVHGLVVGAAIGVAIAPQEGSRTREQVRVATEQARRGWSRAQETARRFVPQVRDVAETAKGVVAGVRARAVGAGDELPPDAEAAAPGPALNGRRATPGFPVRG